MIKNYTPKETAQFIRKELKQNFPGTKFSVNSDIHAVSIEWFDGASFNQVRDLTAKFQGKPYLSDRNQEKITTNWKGEEVCFDTFVNRFRNFTPGFARKVLAYCIEKYCHRDDLDMAAVTIDINTIDEQDHASFNNSQCQESAPITQGSVANILKTLRDISAHDELNWAKDQAQIEAEKQAERLEIEKKIQARQTFVDKQICTLPKIEEESIIIDNSTCRLIGTEAVLSGDGSEENPFTLEDWLYVFVGEDGRKRYRDLPEVEEILNPITPLTIIPCDFRIKGQFASLNNCDSIYQYRSQCLKSRFYFERNEKFLNWTDENCLVVEKIILSPEDYDRFGESLLVDRDWLKGKGGSDTDAVGLPDLPFNKLTGDDQKLWLADSYSICLAITAEDRITFLVNPESYSHARYVGLVPNSIDQKLAEFSAPCNSNLTSCKQEIEDSELEELYKRWTRKLITSDRLNEITAFKIWKRELAPSLLQREKYTAAILQSLNQGSYSEILSLEDWLLTLN